MTAQHRALIVDDEAPAREFLRKLLLAHPEVEVVGEAANVTDAIAQYHRLNPDLIFLDVQMPKRDGFALLPELRPVPDIIFITAYDSFAVKAFEVNAVDFLTKPFEAPRLALALGRLRKCEPRSFGHFAKDDFIILYSDLESCVVSPPEILSIEADGNYSRVHIRHRESMFVRRTMAEWEKSLPSDVFARLDRSMILNLRNVSEMVPLPHRHLIVKFKHSPEQLELGRMAARRLRKEMRRLSAAS